MKIDLVFDGEIVLFDVPMSKGFYYFELLAEILSDRYEVCLIMREKGMEIV